MLDLAWSNHIVLYTAAVSGTHTFPEGNVDGSKYKDFGEFFRAEIMPDLIRHIEPALNQLRRSDPKEWLRIATELRQRGSYDRLEEMHDQEDALKALIDMIQTGLLASVPEFVRQYNLAMEQHYHEHGLELDDMMRKHPNAEPMSAKESIDAQLRAMGIKINPDDPR